MSNFRNYRVFQRFPVLFQKFHISNNEEFTNFLKEYEDDVNVGIYTTATHMVRTTYIAARDWVLYIEGIDSIITRHPACIKITAILGPPGSSELIICTKK